MARRDLETALDRADRLVARDRADEALELLVPFESSFPRDADLQTFLGYARLKTGDLLGSLEAYERAQMLSKNPELWMPLAALYSEMEFHAYALRAFRQVLKHRLSVPFIDEVHETTAALEEYLQDLGERLGTSTSKVQEGLIHLEDGIRALQKQEYRACIAANRRAIRLLGDWPPPHNNLSQALFFDGQPDQAITVARRVLRQDPENLQALSNAVRFLAWTGQERDARVVWRQLEPITPADDGDRVKMAEAAAALGEDERAYQLLIPLDKATRPNAPGFSWSIQRFLAVAEANLGKREAASRFRSLNEVSPRMKEFEAAVKAGRPGPGWSQRYPYYHSSELIPWPRMEEFIQLMGDNEEAESRSTRRQIEQFLSRFPQLMAVGRKLIYEESLPAVGIDLLARVATPEAFAALREFATGQIGDDETRNRALFQLREAGGIQEGETVQVWRDGEQREIMVHLYKVTDQGEAPYAPDVMEIMQRGLTAFQADDLEQAERLFQQMLELEPQAKEAYNNLATIAARWGDTDRAQAMYREALAIDPLYVYPRCNLVDFLLADDDIEGARELLIPLSERSSFHPHEMAFYLFCQARVAVAEDDYDSARGNLEAALDVLPDYKPAQELLDRLDRIDILESTVAPFFEKMYERRLAARARLQAKLSVPDPSLVKALPLYSKEVLTGMARVILPWGGWSALRKAELVEELLVGLRDPDNIERIVTELDDEEREALSQVVAGDGHIAWSVFDAAYGNDLDESPYWNHHVPETVMGRLRRHGLLVETTVNGELLLTVPQELRRNLERLLKS